MINSRTNVGALRRSLTAAVGTAALGMGLLVSGAGSAAAFDTGGGGDDPRGSVPGETVTGPTTGQVGNCSVVSSPAYLGLSCGSASGDGLTVKQILKGDPVPGCWHEPLTEAELAAIGYENGPGASRWFWERCLKGINRKTLQIEPGGIRFTIGLVSLGPGDPIHHLTAHQAALVEFHNDDQQIPAPVAIASPSARPRVGAWVSFFNGTEDEVTASAGAVQLRARITDIAVEPLGARAPDADTVRCEGTGIRAASGDTPETLPGACWYRYEKSSSGQPLVTAEGQPAYPVVITATWAVDVVVGGTATPFNSFTKSQVTSLPVTEIQAIVVN